MYIIRSNLLDLLAQVPGIGNLDFVVARTINIAEPPGVNIIHTITIQYRTSLNVLVSGNHAINLVR